jgi:hypothetical protein
MEWVKIGEWHRVDERVAWGRGGRGKAEEWWTQHFKNVLTRDGIELLNNMSYRASLLNFLLYVFHFVIPVLA